MSECVCVFVCASDCVSVYVCVSVTVCVCGSYCVSVCVSDCVCVSVSLLLSPSILPRVRVFRNWNCLRTCVQCVDNASFCNQRTVNWLKRHTNSPAITCILKTAFTHTHTHTHTHNMQEYTI